MKVLRKYYKSPEPSYASSDEYDSDDTNINDSNPNIYTNILYKQCCFVDGKQEGVEETYYRNGNILSKTNFVNGMKNGIQTDYYENGNVELICFYDNFQIQYCKRYDENGDFKEITYYTNGCYTKNIEYYPNGNIKKSGEFIDGFSIKEHKYYSEDGSLETTIREKEGRKINI